MSVITEKPVHSQAQQQVLLQDCRQAALDRQPERGQSVLWVVVPAAGSGQRVGGPKPKQYLMLDDRCMLAHSVRAFSELARQPDLVTAGAVVVVDPSDVHWETLDLAGQIADDSPLAVMAMPVGGQTRQASVTAGLQLILQACGDQARRDWVLVHDAARPGLSWSSLLRLVKTCLAQDQGGLLAMPIADTVKRGRVLTPADATPGSTSAATGPSVAETVDRSHLWAAQTPQMFRLGELLSALQAADQVTDEASAMEQAGQAPLLVLGDEANNKITFADDLQGWQIRRGRRMSSIRIGQGFDVHALGEGRRLVMGGVEVPYHLGLVGHSDADVLLHAVSDAILGAVGLGDIGQHFPDTDAAYAGADSRALLRHVVGLARREGFGVTQVDATIIAQAPKMAPHIPRMVDNLREDTQTRLVNVKATTTEKLGFTGRGEGIAAQAVVLLSAL
jgi:2-C-methyl-D-erythritol 4-phosphate cytidylyltransferase/2-C-methyl-D-erythritol 2,4-cyclodiphosphate synthase